MIEIKLFTVPNLNYENDDGRAPAWWYNFIDSMPGNDISEIAANQCLVPYNAITKARRVDNTLIRYVVFKSQCDYVEFVLRWS